METVQYLCRGGLARRRAVITRSVTQARGLIKVQCLNTEMGMYKNLSLFLCLLYSFEQSWGPYKTTTFEGVQFLDFTVSSTGIESNRSIDSQSSSLKHLSIFCVQNFAFK